MGAIHDCIKYRGVRGVDKHICGGALEVILQRDVASRMVRQQFHDVLVLPEDGDVQGGQSGERFLQVDLFGVGFQDVASLVEAVVVDGADQ